MEYNALNHTYITPYYLHSHTLRSLHEPHQLNWVMGNCSAYFWHWHLHFLDISWESSRNIMQIWPISLIAVVKLIRFMHIWPSLYFIIRIGTILCKEKPWFIVFLVSFNHSQVICLVPPYKAGGVKSPVTTLQNNLIKCCCILFW